MRIVFSLFCLLFLLCQISRCQTTEDPDGNDISSSSSSETTASPTTTGRPKINKSLKKKINKLKTKAEETSTPTPVPTTTTTPSPVTPEPVEHLSQRHRLRHKLLVENKYDKLAHPIRDHDAPVQVDIGMAIINANLEEASSIFIIDAWMRLTWTDENIVWNASDYGDIKQLHFGEKELWRPDVLLYNNADSTRFDPYGSAHFLVQSSGEVLWVPPAHLRAFCKMDFTYWPMDTHECKLKFGSWTSHGDEIALGLYQNNAHVEMLNFYTNNREWDIKDMSAYKKNVQYDCCPEDYPEVTFKLFLSRNAPGYKSVIVLPCLVIMLMTICSYLLPPNAGEKLILNGFAFLTCVLYLIFFAFTMPFHQTNIPIIVMFYSNTCALVGIGILLNAACINMSRVRRYTGPPKFLKGLFAGSIGRLLCLGNYAHQTSFTHQRLVLELTDMAESEQGNGGASSENGNGIADEEDQTVGLPKPDYEQSGVMRDWILVAAGLERMFFMLYMIIFAVVTSAYV